MTARQRQDLLQAELDFLLKLNFVSDPDGKPPSELIGSVERMAAELEKVNAFAASKRYRFWEASHDFRLLIWITFCFTLCGLPISLLLDAGWAVLINLAAVVGCLAWALWSNKEPQP